MEMVNIKINGMPLSVPNGISILEAARYAGIEIPTLCFLKDINEIGACRICMVEVKGARSLVTACVYPVNEGMEVFTNTEKVRNSRKITLELILSTHDRKCLSCVRSGSCELQQLCKEFGVDDETRYEGANPHYEFDDSAAHMIRDNNKCILCRRCVAACDMQKISVIGANARGFDTHISSAFDKDLADVSCISCGQCIVNCPTGALVEKDDSDKVLAAINDPEKYVIVQTAPSIRATLGECFGMSIGTNVQGKMVAALRRLGFDKVFDTDFAADLTIMEEGSEFVEFLGSDAPRPMFTSCCPGWVRFVKQHYPQFTAQLSSAKSPHQMMGAVVKNTLAAEAAEAGRRLFVVSIMPCVAKKYECDVPELSTVVGATHGAGTSDAGLVPDAPVAPELAAEAAPDVDAVLTVREFGRLLRLVGVDCTALSEAPFDNPLGLSTGAATIFGRTGGVMEAALRSAAYLITGENPDFSACDTTAATSETPWMSRELSIGDATVRIAVASGLENTSKLLDALESGEAAFDFVEIMACPGGCVGGGGQPIQFNSELAQVRAGVLNRLDAADKLRYSHENPDIAKLYADWIGEPLSHTAHEWLHTDQESWQI